MRFLVAHLLTGTIGSCHRDITATLADWFNKEDVADSIAPHLTLKSPFTADEAKLKTIKEVLKEFVKQNKPVPVTFSDFGHFGTRVIYLDAETNSDGSVLLENLFQALSDIQWLQMGKYDDDITLHATLVRPRNRTEFQAILSFLHAQYNVNVAYQLDTVAILKKEDDRWREIQTYSLH
jgi:2'-5' RNA ligase